MATIESIRLGEVEEGQWIKQAFFSRSRVLETGSGSGSRRLAKTQITRNTYNSAANKFSDTTLGGNKSINSAHQFTRFADPKEPSLAGASKGMGRYYSEAIDDNSQRISLQFGVPRFNSTTRFFSSFYDRNMGDMANTGRSESFSYTAGKIAGFILTLPIQAYFGLNYLYTRISSVLTNTPYSKFYYMDPTMPLYWNAVSTLVNQISVNMGITQGTTASNVEIDASGNYTYKDDAGNASLGTSGTLTAGDVIELNRILPDVLRNTSRDEGGVGYNTIDVYAIATRRQRLADAYYKRLDSLAKNAGSQEEYAESVRSALTAGSLTADSSNSLNSLQDYLTAYLDSPVGRGADLPDPEQLDVPDPNGQQPLDQPPEQRIRVAEEEFSDFLKAELRDGSAFVNFMVDAEKTVSESFSNSVKTSNISETINSASSSARSTRFDFANGNVGDGVIGGLIEGALKSVADVVRGAADSVGLSGLSALGGSAYVDIPQVYDTSTADLTKSSYTISLRTPYGNKMSVLLDLYVPLCMLLAGALPRSTGKSSYTSPFLCRLHSQGRNDIKLGMIDSISIERGVGNVGWSVDGLPTGIDVTVSIVNLNEIMHVPITESLAPNVFGLSYFDEDTALSDYLASLSAVSLYDQYYLWPRLKLAMHKTVADWKSYTSPSHFAQYATSTVPGQLISAVVRGGEL